ncbi:MAG TPA: (S)-ureidoglycine aminohydrolase [Acidobacteriaceae bacterium]|nr:(S)-ureidoglycine aminohydrolase [Acidobacteriaceae bacterium]
MHNYGETRSRNRRDHLLLTPDTFVRTSLPGVERGAVVVHVSPAVGAGFTQYSAELESDGAMNAVSAQRFIYVLSGTVDAAAETGFHTLEPGSYAYLPAGLDCRLTARKESRLAVIEKPYEPLVGADSPGLLVGTEATVTSIALNGDEDLQVRSLLPEKPAFDFAVNTMTYQPGAALSQVEIHVMEHGLLMLEGGGVYRLGDGWYPVKAGDFIWMAPYCPQWFGALGKTAAKYLIYKDWNRHPLG